MQQVSEHVGIPTCDLVKADKANVEHGGGTWIHPLLVHAFAQWFSSEFYVLVSQHLDRVRKQPQTEPVKAIAGSREAKKPNNKLVHF